MTLEMYVGGQLVEAAPLVGAFLHRHKHYLNGVMKALAQKHRPLVEASGEKPTFYLCGVSSRINHFTPLSWETRSGG